MRHGGRIILIAAERVIVSTGGVSQPMPFPGVDRPGVYAARGLLALHEECNLRWATDRGAALPQHDPDNAGEWLTQWIEDGVLASAAEAGMCLPQMGVYEIADQVDNA